jgi:hypothetical protein
MSASPNLASNLVGKRINGWLVEKKISKVGGTGGAFSSGYVVRHEDGRRAFMKAINIQTGMARPNAGGRWSKSMGSPRALIQSCAGARYRFFSER